METTNGYTQEQLASAGEMFGVFTALSHDEQKTVAMTTNAFMQGMKAQKELSARQCR